MATDSRPQLQTALNVANQAVKAARDAAFARQLAHFKANGGCETCHGRGWIVVWDTLDSMTGCYHESGACPEAGCTAETRSASGFHPSNSKYDSFHQGGWAPTKEEQAEINRLAYIASDAQSDLTAEEDRWVVREGAEVEVTRKSKVRGSPPVGTRGIVKKVWVPQPTGNRPWYGGGTVKVILTLADGTEAWTARDACKVVDPDPRATGTVYPDPPSVPVLGTYKGMSLKGRAACFVLVNTGKEEWITLDRMVKVENAKGDRIEPKTGEIDRRVAKGEAVSIFVEPWLANRNGWHGANASR